MFRLIIYLPCFDPCVLLLVLSSSLLPLQTDVCNRTLVCRPKCSQIVRILLPCFYVSWYAFVQECATHFSIMVIITIIMIIIIIIIMIIIIIIIIINNNDYY